MPASPQDLFRLFDRLGIETTTLTHEPMHTVEDSKRLRGSLEGGHCKCLFLKDKKGAFLLVALGEDGRLDMKALFASGLLKVGKLSFASPERMQDMLGVKPGSVTPFSLINADPERIIVVLDQKMLEKDRLNYHPLHNGATTTIKREDLLKFIQHFSFETVIIDFDEL